jgi:hypothetical protein
LTSTADIAEEESVERDLLAVDGWAKGCVYAVFAALLAHMGEGGMVSWRLDALCFYHFAEVVLIGFECQYHVSVSDKMRVSPYLT